MRQTTREVRERIAATMEAAEGLCQRARGLFSSCMGSSDAFAVELLLREALTNAVYHGCSCDPAHVVSCEIRIEPESLTLAIEHDGEGFDWRAALAPLTDQEATSGRGLSIFQCYASELQFNERGNRIVIRRTFRDGRSH